MTKKHFIAIAAEIRQALRESCDVSESYGIEKMAIRLCTTFKSANPNFDRSRFLAACGVDPS